MCRSFAAGLLALTFAQPIHAQADSNDIGRSLFTWRDGLLAGGFVLGTIAIRPLDKSAAELMQRPERQQSTLYQLSAKGLRVTAMPGAYIIGTSMYIIGRVTKEDRMAELGFLGTEALVIGEVSGFVLKGFFGRARPWVDTVPNPDNWQLFRGYKGQSRFQSFPSGHTTAAFAAAAAVSTEASRWWPHAIYFIGPALYGGAGLVGVSRMYNNRHWASDVIMGAAIGTFAGIKVVRFHRIHPGAAPERWFLRASLSPSDLSSLTLSLVPR